MKKCLSILTIISVFFINTIAEEGLQIYSFDDFRGGLNTKYSPNLLPKTQSPDLRNYIIDEKLGLVKRDSFACVDVLPVSTTTKISKIYTFNMDDGSSRFIVQAGSNVYVTSKLGTTWTLIKAGLSTLYPVRWTTHYGKAIGTNGVNTVISYDGSTLSEHTFMPKGQFIISAEGRVWIASTLDNPSYVYYSEVSVDVTSQSSYWDTEENIIDCGKGDGQVIKGLSYMKGIVWVYKENSVYGIHSITSRLHYSSNYGTVSQRSLSGYKNGDIFLDKKGLHFWTAGNFQYISDNVDTLINKIGIVNTGYCRITNTTNADFNQGTYESCNAISDSIVTSTITKTWISKANFEGTSPVESGYSASQSSATTSGIRIATISGTTESKIDLTYSSVGNFAGYYRSGGLSTGYNNITGGASISTIIDDDPTTHHDTVWLRNGVWSWMAFYQDIAKTPMHISRIKLKYKCEGGNTYTNPNAFNFANHEIWLTNADGTGIYKFNTLNRKIDGIMTTDDFSIASDIYNDAIYGYPTEIQIRGIPIINGDSGINSLYAVGIYYELEAFTSATNPNYWSSGTFISPVVDSSKASTQYKYLNWSDSLTNAISSGTVRMYVSSSTATGIPTSNIWYEVGVASAVSTSVDNQRYVQWKAELWSSSCTFTPTITDVSLTYSDTIISTYTGKVYSVGSKITSWGAFVTDDEGTVTYQVRAATWTFLYNNSNLAWTTITSGSDIGFSTTNVNIQYRAILSSKLASVNSVHITYFEADPTKGGGGNQDIASINYQDKYYLAYSSWTSYNTDLLIFNKLGAYENFTGLPVSAFAKFNNKPYFASSTQPVICEMFTGNTTENAVWSSPHTDLGYPDRDKKVRYLYLTVRPQTGDFTHLDYSNDMSTITYTAYIDLSGKVRNKRVDLKDGVEGKNFYFILHSTSSVKTEIQKIDVYYNLFPLR